MGLCQRGITAGCYHANMTAEDRTKVHVDWINDRIQVSECTHTHTHTHTHTRDGSSTSMLVLKVLYKVLDGAFKHSNCTKISQQPYMLQRNGLYHSVQLK